MFFFSISGNVTCQSQAASPSLFLHAPLRADLASLMTARRRRLDPVQVDAPPLPHRQRSLARVRSLQRCLLSSARPATVYRCRDVVLTSVLGFVSSETVALLSPSSSTSPFSASSPTSTASRAGSCSPRFVSFPVLGLFSSLIRWTRTRAVARILLALRY